MKSTIVAILIMLSSLMPSLAVGSEGNNMEKRHALNKKQRCIIPIAALAADGDIERLRPALDRGLDAGLTESQMKDFIFVPEAKVGKTKAESAQKILAEVLNNRK